ncbi:MAG: hypothetical protein ABII06_22140 [Pseudomonadota bacterium]
MRDTVKIFERTAAAILVSWIFIYGLGYAQTTPCEGVAEAGSRAATLCAMDSACATSPENPSGGPVIPIHCPADTRPCFGKTEACCESKLFGKHYRATDFTPSFRDLPGLLYHGWTPRAAVPEVRHACSSGNRSRATRTVPIYILKQSFIC